MKSLRIFVLSSNPDFHTVLLNSSDSADTDDCESISLADFQDLGIAQSYLKSMLEVLRAGGAKVLECVA